MMLANNCLYILCLTTVVYSKWSSHEKMDFMTINMQKIKDNLGTFTNSLSNTIPQSCTKGKDDKTAVVNINQRRIQLESLYNQSTWQELGAAIRVLKNSFLSMSDRQNKSCKSPEPIPIATSRSPEPIPIATSRSTEPIQIATSRSPEPILIATSRSPEPTLMSTSRSPEPILIATTTIPELLNSSEIITTMISEVPVTKCMGHMCGDGECLPSYWVCDGEEDCKDCSDEKNCTKEDRPDSCPPHMFQCSNEMGTCISREWLCDDLNDCSDGSDEENCTPIVTYGPDDIICGNGSHVPIYYHCDGNTDCDDCVDERHCVKCPEQFTPVGNLCLRIEEKKRTWEEASQHCQTIGDRLAEPRDMDAFKCFMQEKRGMRARYWVGSELVDGSWAWLSGGAPVPRRLLPSGTRHRRYNKADGQCLEIMPMRKSSPFNPSNCKTKFRSLCQIDPIP